MAQDTRIDKVWFLRSIQFQMNTILYVGRLLRSPQELGSRERELINDFIEKMTLELSFDECNKDYWGLEPNGVG